MRILVAALVLWTTTASARGQLPAPTRIWHEEERYLALFAPAGPRAAAYHVYVSPLSVDKVLEELATDPSLLRPPGSWMPALLLPTDAFGQTGRYDRARLTRLYGARRVAVARGPRGADGRPNESWTLISPYPSPDLTRLEPGTMLIVLRLEFP